MVIDWRPALHISNVWCFTVLQVEAILSAIQKSCGHVGSWETYNYQVRCLSSHRYLSAIIIPLAQTTPWFIHMWISGLKSQQTEIKIIKKNMPNAFWSLPWSLQWICQLNPSNIVKIYTWGQNYVWSVEFTDRNWTQPWIKCHKHTGYVIMEMICCHGDLNNFWPGDCLIHCDWTN